jgi:ATP-dependent Clp protease ATP-binding subunit ClpC
MRTIHDELSLYRPARALDGLMSPRVRKLLLALLTFVFLVIGFLVFAYTYLTTNEFPAYLTFDIPNFPISPTMLGGIALIFIGPYLTLAGLHAYYRSLYFRGLRVVMHEELTDEGGVTFEVAEALLIAPHDVILGFLTSPFGRLLTLRLGIVEKDVRLYLAAPRPLISAESLPLEHAAFITLERLALFLYDTDKSLSDFLFKHGIPRNLFAGALEWLYRTHLEVKLKERWWSRDNLGKIRGLGQDFTYGVAYNLRRYTRPLISTGMFSFGENQAAYATRIIERIEETLARTKAANVLLISEAGAGEMDMLFEFSKRLRTGTSVGSITGKILVVFDDDRFVATHGTKQEFEFDFLKLMDEVEAAGNIILVIENVADFIRSAESLEVDLDDLLDRFLASPAIQFVMTTDSASFHEYVEPRSAFMKQVEAMHIEAPDLTNTMRVLESAVLRYEYRHKVRFTYPALRRVAECADQYLVEGVMPDRALSLLAEIAARAEASRTVIITQEFVEARVSEKTGVTIGPIKEDERDMLMRLEERLHARVVGQDDAIRAIANTMRRSRAGIQDKTRPIGSFLFLGSTGVGKTETAKALAFVFFGSEERMLRFDMSEYSDESGLGRLIGDSEHPGTLSSSLKEHPYGVLLLDEFEKAAESVHDLFLQVLDEGMFTDGRGYKYNARNSIIIATSNAGSDIIWKMVEEGRRPGEAKDTVIDAIIEGRVLKPELINRFDSVIIFETLNEREQERIAGLLLGELKARIRARGFDLHIDDFLVKMLVRAGYDPKFGARPMRRAIQDVIEKRIAEKVIEGGLRPGDTIALTSEDFPTIPTPGQVAD